MSALHLLQWLETANDFRFAVTSELYHYWSTQPRAMSLSHLISYPISVGDLIFWDNVLTYKLNKFRQKPY